LKLTIHAPFWGNIFPRWRHPSSWPPKGPSLGGNTSFEPFSVTISATVRPGGRMEKKKYNQKSHTGVIFPLFGGKPPLGRFDPKVAWWVVMRRTHVCRVSNWNLHGLRFYMGVEFSIFLLILAWALQQCSATALPVIAYGDWHLKAYL